ncbi:MAG: hypothetical protein LVQ95_04070 [Candidatus Micrarchaeales archaeon]|nr:hypothetical protein [Candidatus Micrarchaeales archaeon]
MTTKSIPLVVDRFAAPLNMQKTTIMLKVYVLDSFESLGRNPLSYLADLAKNPKVSIDGKPLERHLADAIVNGKEYRFGLAFLYSYMVGNHAQTCYFTGANGIRT